MRIPQQHLYGLVVRNRRRLRDPVSYRSANMALPPSRLYRLRHVQALVQIALRVAGGYGDLDTLTA